ncbi:MAG TPA: phosphoribosylaminoimidazolesuccinocarboxamide synthase [Candidatus Eisenbacteria bacterium]|uniref:Phosphoribosylaminoimidazole-succinocarboxamide synthase n=1 Tax=Eiseniibacteriota bacterium TaxID=2212470 RepID=A0A7V2AV30_UNCEI|nr:phosphoribosylaminoimidazolesuccinocarboxamide synthase [Candidatus Eisenbacteria bacterium]
MTHRREYDGLPGIEPDFKGKVRDIHDLGERLLIIATDRISAYDSVIPTPITGKGVILTTMSAEWFEWFDDVPNHLVTMDVDRFPAPFDRHGDLLKGRSMLVKKAERIDLECVVRGYLVGSGWREYCEKGSVCGIELPEGLALAQKLETPIFTPSTKADSGHDENISFEEASRIVGAGVADELKRISIELYRRANEYASSRGVIIADTKFEFGMIEGRISLIDEVLTPDSSRFWLAEEYELGRPQRSLDKQFVRDYLDEIGWDHDPPAPELPPEVVEKTLARYRLALDRLFPVSKIERYLG